MPTPAQNARLLGINASLKHRGIVVSLLNGTTTVIASLTVLIEDIDPSAEERAASQETRAESRVYVLRSALGATVPVIGQVFKTADNITYRIDEVLPRPTDIFCGYRCESSRPATSP